MDSRDSVASMRDRDSTVWLQVLHQLLNDPANLSTLYWRIDSSFAFHRFHEIRFEELHQLGISSTGILVRKLEEWGFQRLEGDKLYEDERLNFHVFIDYSGAFVPLDSTAIPLMRPLQLPHQRDPVNSELLPSPAISIVDLGIHISNGEREDVFSSDHDTTMMPELVSPDRSRCQPISRTEIRRRLEEHQASTTASQGFPHSSTGIDPRSSTPSFEIEPITQYRDVLLYSSLSSSPMSRTPALSGSTSSESRSSPYIAQQGSNSSSPWVPQSTTFDPLGQGIANLGTSQHRTTFASSPHFDWQSRPAIPSSHPDSQRFPNFDPFYSPVLLPTPPPPPPPKVSPDPPKSTLQATGIDLTAFSQLKPHFYDDSLYRQCITLPPSSLTSDTATSRPLARSQTLPQQSRYPQSSNPSFFPSNLGPTRDLSVSSWVAQQRSINPFQVLETSEIPPRYAFPPVHQTSSLPPQYDPSFHQFGTQQHNSGLGMSLPSLPQHHHQIYPSQSTFPFHSQTSSSHPFPPPGLSYPYPNASTYQPYPHLNPEFPRPMNQQDSSIQHLSQRRHELFSTSSSSSAPSSSSMSRSSQSLQRPPSSARISPNLTLERILNPPYQPQPDSNSKDPSFTLFPSSSLFLPPPPKELGPIGPPQKMEEKEQGGEERGFELFGRSPIGWCDGRERGVDVGERMEN